jgi:hypothetical protein
MKRLWYALPYLLIAAAVAVIVRYLDETTHGAYYDR